MRKAKNLALLLPILPFLMATAALPSPTASIEKYGDISINGTYLGPDSEFDPKMYQYELDIENIGSDYALPSFTHEYSKIYLYLNGFSDSYLFSNHLVAPGEHVKFKVKTDKSDNIDDWSKFDIALYSYSIIDEDVSFQNLSFEKTKYGNCYYYVLKGKIEHLSNYYYDLVFDVVYKNEKYSFSYNLYQNRMSVSEELELDKLEIKSVKAYRSSYKKVEEANWALLFVIAIIVFIAMLFIIFILIPGLIILIVTLSVKHRNKKIIT